MNLFKYQLQQNSSPQLHLNCNRDKLQINIVRTQAVMSIQSKTKFLDETIEYQSSIPPTLHVFILVNSRSGSWVGRELLRKNDQVVVNHNNRGFHFSFWDMYSREKTEACFGKVNQLCEDGQAVRIIMCGGDGTVEWVLNQSINFGVDFHKVVFSVLPLGTGNDFARSIGWGDFKFCFKKLQDLAADLEKSQIGYYDIWECGVSCYPSGKITEIKNGMQNQVRGKNLRMNFSNYFGVGTDARISYFAQKINAKSVFMKKICYGFAWVASLFRYSKKLVNYLTSFTGQEEQLENPIRSNQELQLSNNISYSKNQNINRERQIDITYNDSCITFLNSTSSMELSHIWKTPYSVNQHRNYQSQKIDDGILEVVSYRNEISLLLERSMHMAKKVAQGTGPFLLKFKQGQRQDTYIHINGEPYKIQNLKEIQINRSKQVPWGRIKVLIRAQ